MERKKAPLTKLRRITKGQVNMKGKVLVRNILRFFAQPDFFVFNLNDQWRFF
jgi:hypothetical protein